MAPKFLHRLRRFYRRKKNIRRAAPAPAPREEEPHQTAAQLTEENDKLRQNLGEAIDMINYQKAQLAEYDFLLAHALSETMSSTPPAFQIDEPLSTCPVSPKSPSTDTWIEDLWLCSDSDLQSIRHAQRKWANGRPDIALAIVSNAISTNPFLSPSEEIRCRLFAAAALHSLGQYEESTEGLDKALQMISRGLIPQGFQARELIGIGHYIQARNLMNLEHFSEAFIMLSRALDVTGYGEKARELQQKAFVDFVYHDAANDRTSISSSLQPLLTSRGSTSPSSLELTELPDYPVW